MALLVGASMAGCGDVRIAYGDYHCPRDPPPAIVVEFVAAADGTPVAVGASGTLRDGGFFQQMTPASSRFAGPGRTYALAGGHDREGIYDVRVETSRGEIHEWSRIRVVADRCGPFTVVLQARLIFLD